MCCQAPTVVHVSCITRRCVGGGVLGSMYVMMNMQVGPTPQGTVSQLEHAERMAQALFP